MLVVMDYILSYVGITIGVAYELIPWARWMFHLPFYQGLTLRLLFAGVIVGGLTLAAVIDKQLEEGTK